MRDLQRSWSQKFQALENKLEALEETRIPPNPAVDACSRDVTASQLKTNKRERAKPLQACFVCGTTSRSVHKHRELGRCLDDKCRKQVETFKQGGIITERRSSWSRALRTVPCNSLALKMLHYIEGECDPVKEEQRVSDSKKTKSATPEEEDGSEKFMSNDDCSEHAHKKRRLDDKTEASNPDDPGWCSVCQEVVSDEQQELTRLPCNHTFHGACIHKWLQEQPTCPTCRTPVYTIEAPPGSARPCFVSPTLCAGHVPCENSCTDSCNFNLEDLTTGDLSCLVKSELSDCATQEASHIAPIPPPADPPSNPPPQETLPHTDSQGCDGAYWLPQDFSLLPNEEEVSLPNEGEVSSLNFFQDFFSKS